MQIFDKDVRDVILQNETTFTLQSSDTGTKLHYRLMRSKLFDKMYNVYTLVKDKNITYYDFAGTYVEKSYFRPIDRYRNMSFFAKPKEIRTLEWFFKHLQNIPEKLLLFVEENND